MRLYAIAGERSGDLHLSNLIEALQQQQPELEVRGVAGELSQAQRMDLFLPYAQVAFMGFWEVAKNLLTIRRIFRQVQADIASWQPDALLLVDFSGFNLRVARWAHARGIRVIYYIAPKVWAWNQGRVRGIRESVDLLLCILPFELDFFTRHGCNARYIGNPLLDEVERHCSNPDPDALHLPAGAFTALLPGSRHQEVASALPIFAQLAAEQPERSFVVCAVTNLPSHLYEAIARLPNVQVMANRTYDVLQRAENAVVVSGTATLETALLDCPQVVVYRTSAVTYAIASRLIQIPYISLVNLIAGRLVVPELIQTHFNPGQIARHLSKLTPGTDTWTDMKAGYRQVQDAIGHNQPSRAAATEIIAYLSQ